MTTSSPNADTLDACLRYADGPTNGLGLMLVGPWGCGKSWFVRNRLIPAFAEKQHGPPRKALYVSLNGRQTKEEILADLTGAYCMAFDDRGLRTSITRLANAVRQSISGSSIDHWTIQTVAVAARAFSSTSIWERLLAEKPVAIILDDFERHKMDDGALLGLIAHFTEHLRTPVFLVGNFDVAFNRPAAPSGVSLSVVIEKVVGLRLAIVPEIPSVVDAGISAVADGRTRRFLIGARDTIVSILGRANDANLRSVPIAINAFAAFDECIVKRAGGRLSECADKRERALRYALALAIDSRQRGATCADSLATIGDLSLYVPEGQVAEESADRQRLQIALISIYLDESAVLDAGRFAPIADLIDCGVLRVPLIEQLCDEWLGIFQSSQQRLLALLTDHNHWNMSDDEFESAVTDCLELLDSGGVSDPAVFRRLSRSLLEAATWEWTTRERPEIERRIAAAIAKTWFSVSPQEAFEWDRMSWPATSEGDKWLMSALSMAIKTQRVAAMREGVETAMARGPLPLIKYVRDHDDALLALVSHVDPARVWNAYFELKNREAADFHLCLRDVLIKNKQTLSTNTRAGEWFQASLKILTRDGRHLGRGLSKALIRQIVNAIEESVA